jgi:hypothetical protein
MTVRTAEPQTRESLRSLSKDEIDRRIEKVLAQVASADGLIDLDPDGDPLRPRWISTAEFVRRMRPFLVYN